MPVNFRELESRAGVVFMGVQPEMLMPGIAHDANMAYDAQPTLITTSSAGIPAMLSTVIDPKVIEIALAPIKAAEAVGSEIKKGDWVTDTIMFPVVESTGESTTYGDYNNSGSAGANTNFPQRQSFHHQVITRWGEREMERAGLAKIDWANRVSIASIMTLNKRQNKTYLFGVSGLQNYGMTNDPALTAPISPITKTAGGTKWINTDGSPNATNLEVLKDVQKLYTTLQGRLNGLVELDSPLTMIMSPRLETALTYTNDYGKTAKEILLINFPNLKFKTVPEYSTASGELVQLVLDESPNGQRTWDCAFTEKLRAHPIKIDLSAFSQKKSQGTWGTVIYAPMNVQGGLGY